MDRATFERQKAFAGEKKPSMQRRCVDHDYTERRMYMVTMVTEERKPLFGKVAGRSEAVEPSADVPHIELSPLGKVPLGVKQACNQAFREVMPVAFVAMAQQHAGRSGKAGRG
jgi:hypothetical protein